MALNFDLIEPGVLTGFVRELPVPANYVLNRFLPDQNIGDIEAAFSTAFHRNRAAMFRAFDAETPIGERDNFQRSRVALPPLSQKMLVGEEERLKLEMLRSGGDNTSSLIHGAVQRCPHQHRGHPRSHGAGPRPGAHHRQILFSPARTA
jgi:hypothetical protein